MSGGFVPVKKQACVLIWLTDVYVIEELQDRWDKVKEQVIILHLWLRHSSDEKEKKQDCVNML